MTTSTIATASSQRCFLAFLPIRACSHLKCALGFAPPIGRAAIAFAPPPASTSVISSLDDGTTPSLVGHDAISNSISLLLSDASSSSDGGGFDILGAFGGIVGAVLLLAIAIFATAKITLKPELAEGAEWIKEIEKTQNVLLLVKEQRNGGRDMDDLIEPLQNVFGTTIEEYVASVEAKSDATDVDRELAALLRTVYLSDGNTQ